MQHRSRLTRLLALAFMACVVVSNPAAAGSATANGPDISSGKPGQYIDRDDDNHVAVCSYDTDGNLTGFRAAAPVAWARTGRTKQRIGLQMAIEAWNGFAWVKWKTTRWQYRTATPSTGSTFTTRVLQTAASTTLTGPYRFRMNLRWYAKDGTTVNGRVSLWRDMVVWKLTGVDPIPSAKATCIDQVN